jgi:hypothetical protein
MRAAETILPLSWILLFSGVLQAPHPQRKVSFLMIPYLQGKINRQIIGFLSGNRNYPLL